MILLFTEYGRYYYDYGVQNNRLKNVCPKTLMYLVDAEWQMGW